MCRRVGGRAGVCATGRVRVFVGVHACVRACGRADVPSPRLDIAETRIAWKFDRMRLGLKEKRIVMEWSH